LRKRIKKSLKHTANSLKGDAVAALVNPEELAKKQFFLILVSPANIRQRNIELIKEISSLGYHTVVITTNSP
jgi:hypothetical protein